MKKIMFNDKYGLTNYVLQKHKELTRRLLKNQTGNLTGYIQYTKPGSTSIYVRADFDNGLHEDCPYAIGEIVAVGQCYADIHSELMIGDFDDGRYDSFKNAVVHDKAGWYNKMFVIADLMPHRIQILDIRAERLQDITDEDCLKEGVLDVTYFEVSGVPYELFALLEHEGEETFNTPREAFAALIDKISGRGTWDNNPFVWRIEFKLVK